MNTAKEAPLFLDTSIQIARRVHGRKTKEAIEARLAKHEHTVTSLVVRQEYKRRLLKEAVYLLGLLHRYESFDEVHQHVIRLFGPWKRMLRKRTICLQMISQIHEGANDAERAERLQYDLRSLLTVGLQRFDQSVDQVKNESNCACAKWVVVERKPLHKYDLGPERCSRLESGQCGVTTFLAQRRENCEQVLAKLRSLSSDKKSAELQRAEQFLEDVVSGKDATKVDPCLTVGDAVIALESIGIPIFFTLNSMESQHLCRALNQSMIVRPVDAGRPEVLCAKDEPQWPEFG
jgi:hypothetical protein